MARPAHGLFRVTAERVVSVTPRMRRVTVDGSCLPPVRAGLPAQWLKVFVPAGEEGGAQARAYTVRRVDPESGKLDLDFVLHGDNGPASAWAARVEPGDAFEISAVHPRSGFPIDPATRRYVMFGDETALPAIGGILEALPAHAHAEVFVEVADAAEEQVVATTAKADFTWLHREGGGTSASGGLYDVAKALARPTDDTAIWVAAEASVMKSLRALALSEWGVDRRRLHAAGYWKRGAANHRDAEAPG